MPVNLDADAGEFALGVDLQVLEGVGRQQGGVGIQPLEHALDGLLDEVLGLDLIHVVLLDQLDDIGEDLQLVVQVVLAG
ncbi:MAG: hypothetical protein H6R38_557 [Deltaproteobacteria bacterium]|nr:hypothetical protein [Deltaproteobacteria bacterium]